MTLRQAQGRLTTRLVAFRILATTLMMIRSMTTTQTLMMTRPMTIPTVIPGKFLDDDSLGGWIISSLSDGWFGGAFYNMGLRRFRLEADDS